MKIIRRALFTLAIVLIPFGLSIQESYGGAGLSPEAGFPTGPACQSIDDCPLGYGDCAPDPAGGSDTICIPMFCGADSDCLSGQCDVGVCAIPGPIGPISDAIVVSGNDPNTGECEIGSIDTSTGVYKKMYPAGCNECGGLDTDDNGNLLVACGGEPIDAGAEVTTRGVLLGKVVEIDTLNGRQISANEHGRSNYMADVTVLPDQLFASYETQGQDMVHTHDKNDNYVATPNGPTGLELEHAGLTKIPERRYLTLATNSDGTPELFDIDPETAQAMFVRPLVFPADVVISSENTSRAVALEDISILALDHVAPDSFFPSTGILPGGFDQNSRAAALEKYDMAVLLRKQIEIGPPTTDDWAAIALIDQETGMVGDLLEVRGHGDLELTGLTIMPKVQRNVPTMSEWGLMATALILGIIGYIAIYRRKMVI